MFIVDNPTPHQGFLCLGLNCPLWHLIVYCLTVCWVQCCLQTVFALMCSLDSADGHTVPRHCHSCSQAEEKLRDLRMGVKDALFWFCVQWDSGICILTPWIGLHSWEDCPTQAGLFPAEIYQLLHTAEENHKNTLLFLGTSPDRCNILTGYLPQVHGSPRGPSVSVSPDSRPPIPTTLQLWPSFPPLSFPFLLVPAPSHKPSPRIFYCSWLSFPCGMGVGDNGLDGQDALHSPHPTERAVFPPEKTLYFLPEKWSEASLWNQIGDVTPRKRPRLL